MQLGAVVADQSQKNVKQIAKYGEIIGKAFQLKDDILDCISTEKVVGKAIGVDVNNGVKTAILWHFVQKATTTDLEKARRIYMREREARKEIEEIIALFDKYGSIAYAETEVDRLAERATERFEEVSQGIPESDLKETARDAINKLASRQK
jgi:geranylgeranyl pyrophosphate synthase